MSENSINNILIIDDSVDYRQLLKTFFKKAFPDAVAEEYDPAKGRPTESFSWSRYDLLILDYDLGNGENGLEWLRNFKTSSDFPPTIMLTAQEDEELVVNAIRYGAQSFLRKLGLTKALLLEAVKSALKKHHEEKEKASSQKIQVHLYNKEKFFNSLKKISKYDLVTLIELHDFPALQERLGIFAIDNFVNFFSETLSESLHKSGFSAQMTRISDSTMAVLVENTSDSAKVEGLLKNICSDIDNTTYRVDDEEVNFLVNIGAVIIDQDKPEIHAILSSVEGACRRARTSDGNTYILVGNTESISENDQELANQISAAIKDNRVTPLFQSLILVSGINHKDFDEIYQTRVNILDAEDNVLEPKIFLPVLEKTKSLKKLDRWIIRHCLGELASLGKNSEKLPGILIPISAQSINDKDLTDWINKIIQYVKMPTLGKGLIFEILADDFINMSAQAKLQFNKLRIKLESSIALSNVNDLQTLEKCVNQGKFDFILFSPEHTAGKKMQFDEIKELVNVAKQHKSMTVASRIDSGEYLALSASAGVDYVLGHFVQPPMEKIISTEEVEVRY